MTKTIEKLIQEIQTAPDFGYDDLSVKLNYELKKIGKKWKWSNDYKPKVIIYDDKIIYNYV